ncbi:hypothetical protein niasHT_028691 [Heterodera trifolii]|uniref:Major facilitator superfamily (MFS) profile domain-containing protein n=1 Tax=Heterodera trifolii TaxID=157864 RepID=A0ABD2JEB6_9BILA
MTTAINDINCRFNFGGLRFVILALSTLCLTFSMCGTVVLHMTVICMREVTTTNATSYSAPLFSFAEEGWLFSALYLGTLLGTIPIGHLCTLVGFRRTFTAYGILNGLGTVSVPLAAQFLTKPFSFMAIFGARFFQGFNLSISMVAIETISKNWSTLKEMTLFISILSIHFQLGRIITMPLSGFLCDSSLGWPSVYYLLGIPTLFSFSFFCLFYRDTPSQHRLICVTEMERIQSGKMGTSETRGHRKGFKFFANWHLLSLFGVCIGIAFGAHTFSLYGPIYLHNSIGINMHQTGIVVALPFVISTFLSIAVGRICDRLIGTKAALVLLTCVSQYGMAISYALLAFITPSNPLLIQTLYVIIMSLVGLLPIGLVKQARWVDAENAQSINSMNTAIAYILVMLIPEFVTLIIPNPDDQNGRGWNIIFLFIAILQTVSAAISHISIMTKKQ